MHMLQQEKVFLQFNFIDLPIISASSHMYKLKTGSRSFNSHYKYITNLVGKISAYKPYDFVNLIIFRY